MSARTCPQWCIGSACKGEHNASVADTVPATAGLPSFSRYGEGFYFPGVKVSLSHDELDHLQPSVTLWVSSEQHDAQADLHAHEARQLIATLQLALDVLESRASLTEPEWPRLARVEDYRGEVTT